jgi:hypothetical protein
LPTPEAIRAHLESLSRELQEHLESEREALRASKIKDAWTLLGITAPFTLGSAWAISGAAPILAATGGFGAVGLGLLGWYLDKKLKKRTEGSYLLTLEKTMDGVKRCDETRCRMRRLLANH